MSDTASGMMAGWRGHNPVDIRFGYGRIDELPSILRGRSYILLTHSNQAMSAWTARIRERCGAPLLAVSDIESHPSLDMLRALLQQLEDSDATPDAIVALGGGSVLDAAKFLAASRGRYRETVQHMENGTPLSDTTDILPIIAIPTTAGTGSDLTKWATVWDTMHGRKLSLEHARLYPEVSLVDPALTETLPWESTLASGLDAMSHALESIWNINANPVSTGLAVAAALDVMSALPGLRNDLWNRPARMQLARGATAAGLAFSATKTALAHSISYPVTIENGVAHGIACSFCLPEVMAAALGERKPCDDALARIFGDLAEAPLRLRSWLDALAVPSHPQQFGMTPDRWQAVVRAAFDGVRGRNFIGTLERFPLRMMTSAGA